MTYYYAIIGTSRNACGGVRWAATANNTETDIIGWARSECAKSGESLEALAGIKSVGINPDADGDFESFEPEREWAEGEEFAVAVEKLNDDGRTFRLFTDASAFVMEADEVGLGDKARALALGA